MGRRKIEDVTLGLPLEDMNTSHLDKLLVDIIRTAGDTGIRQSEIGRELARLTGRRIDRKKLERHIKDIYNDGDNPWGIGCVGFERDSEAGAYLTGYHLDGHTSLSAEDLRFLITRVEFDPALSSRESRLLINKLKNTGGEPYRAASGGFVNREAAPTGRTRGRLGVSRESVGQMRRAIDRGSKVSLRECEVNERLEAVPYGTAALFEPYKLISSAGYDYVIGVLSGERELRHYRLDRISFQAVKGEHIDTFLRDNTLRAELESYLKDSAIEGQRRKTSALFAIDPHRIGELADSFGAENMHRADLPEEYGDSIGMKVYGTEGSVTEFALKNAEICELVSPQRLRVELKRKTDAISRVYHSGGEDCYDESLKRAERSGGLRAIDVDLTARKEHTALRNVKTARFRNNRLSDFSFLAEYKQLHTLSVSDNPVSDFSAIKELPHLSNLHISNTNLDSLDFLRGNTSVRALSLGNNPIEDLSALYELYDLDYLCVDSETYGRLDIDRLMKRSPSLTVKSHCCFLHRARYSGYDIDTRMSEEPFPLNFLYHSFDPWGSIKARLSARERESLCSELLAIGSGEGFVNRALDSLKPSEGEVMRMLYLEGKSVRQTARERKCKIREVLDLRAGVDIILDLMLGDIVEKHLRCALNHPALRAGD